ncbi:hypothetical protein SK128_022439 [Halocaridina rubra]|uniref:Glucosylceramidase n=1 Tax=Halocaridina rubra TaxID=373956 RepID=A0AAN8ZYI3_HALRR
MLIGGCNSRDFGHGSVVCVCNASYCDEIIPLQPPEAGKIQVAISSKAGSRWNITELQFQEHENDVVSAEAVFYIDKNKATLYQEIIGFGGAFTDAAGMNIMSVAEPLQNLILRNTACIRDHTALTEPSKFIKKKAYYSSEGLEYSLSRVPVGGTDFSIYPYTYDDLDLGKTDPELYNFTLAPEDLIYKIPLLKRAISMSSTPLKLFASAWSAPGWMKDSGKIMGKGKLLKQYYSTWAKYYIMFFERYAEHNITFWGLTAQNEPTDGLVEYFNFNALGWTSFEQAQWIGEYLGPALRNSSFAYLQVMVLDDNRFLLPKWVDDVMSDSQASEYVSGVAVHWYLDWVTPPHVLDLTHDRNPHLFLLYTEACTGSYLNLSSVP